MKKHQKIAIKFLILVFVWGLASLASASEVTGTMSSSGQNQNQEPTQTKGDPSPSSGKSEASDNGNTAGNVQEAANYPSSESGSRESANGDGETMAATPTTALSPAGTQRKLSQGPSAEAQAVDPDTGVSREPSQSSQAAAAFGAFSQFSSLTRSWIILLSLILIVLITYIYKRDKGSESIGLS